MKSFDEFLQEFNKFDGTITAEELTKDSTDENLNKAVVVLVSALSMIDKRSEDRLRAYHEWISRED